LTLEITEGITEHANRVALKGVFSAFGDVLACWVPPIDRRHVDAASVRFAVAESAECAKVACDQGQVFFQGLPLKVKWRAGGGPRVGNSDIGGTVGGNSPTRQSLRDRSQDRGNGGRRRGEGNGGRRRSRSRRRRSSSRNKFLENEVAFPAGSEPFNPLADAPMMPPQQFMPPEMMMQMQQPSMGMPPMGMGGGMGMPSIQAMPEMLPPTREEIEAEERRKIEAKARRAAQLKRGPGVAALVQGALKNAQTSSANNKKDQDDLTMFFEKEEPKKKREPEKTKAEIEAERKHREEEEARERARQEREALEREKEKARQKAIEMAKEEERLKAEAEERESRVRQGVEAAKRQQAQREGRAGPKGIGPANLYGDMPDAGYEPEDDAAAQKKRKEEKAAKQRLNFNLPAEDNSKIVFLDIDGVLRPARAGGFDILSDGKETTHPDTSDFFPSAMKALRHIMERTGAIIVLSSEWRRSEALRDSIDEVLEANRIRPSYDWTSVEVDEVKMTDPVRSFADRRAREVSDWLRKHEDQTKGWVVLDDINLAIADEDNKQSAKSMAPKLVQTWPLCGLTMGNAKTAVRILNGEMIHKVLVERPKAPGGINIGGGGAVPPGRV